MMIVVKKQSAQLENKQHIDNLFGKLREAEVKPSANMWERIDTELHGPAPVSPNSYFSYSAFRMASSLLLILVLYIGWNAFMVGSTPEQISSDIAYGTAPSTNALFPDFELKSSLSNRLIALNQLNTPSVNKVINYEGTDYSNSTLAILDFENTAPSVNTVISRLTKTKPQIELAADNFTEEVEADAILDIALAQRVESIQINNIENPISKQNFNSGSEQIQQTSILEQHVAEIQEELDNQLSYTNHNSFHEGGEFYGGINASLNVTGLMSEFSSVKHDENLNPGIHAGRSFGLTLGYQISPRTALEAGLIIDSRQGSVYDSEVLQRQESVEVKKRIDLHYTQLPLAVRIQRVYPNTIGKNPLVFNYVIGAQYGLLRASRFSLEDKYVSPDRNLQQHDFAVLLGAEYDLYFSKNLFASLGVRGTISANQTQLTDIDGINRDKRNVVIGLRAGINYVLPSWN